MKSAKKVGSFERLTIQSMSTKKVKKFVDFRRCQIDIYKASKTMILCTSFAYGEAISKAFFECVAVKISRG